jgi:hypothetical protein
MSNKLEVALSRIPHKDELVKKGLEAQVTSILEQVVDEFPSDNIMAKAVDKGTHWQWFMELKMEVPEILQHAVRDALVEKSFDQVHFNPYSSFEPGETRMSITVRKGDL